MVSLGCITPLLFCEFFHLFQLFPTPINMKTFLLKLSRHNSSFSTKSSPIHCHVAKYIYPAPYFSTSTSFAAQCQQLDNHTLGHISAQSMERGGLVVTATVVTEGLTLLTQMLRVDLALVRHVQSIGLFQRALQYTQTSC